MGTKLADAYLRNVVRTYRTYKEMAERAIEQVPSEEDLSRELDESSNSIAIIVKHMSGNLRSRFRDFLTSDGEKPDRNRDSEFESDERELDRGAFRGRSRAHGSNSGRRDARRRSAQQICDTRGLSRWANCLPRSTFRVTQLENLEHSQGPVVGGGGATVRSSRTSEIRLPGARAAG
jgi:hypothetical protein